MSNSNTIAIKFQYMFCEISMKPWPLMVHPRAWIDRRSVH